MSEKAKRTTQYAGAVVAAVIAILGGVSGFVAHETAQGTAIVAADNKAQAAKDETAKLNPKVDKLLESVSRIEGKLESRNP